MKKPWLLPPLSGMAQQFSHVPQHQGCPVCTTTINQPAWRLYLRLARQEALFSRSYDDTRNGGASCSCALLNSLHFCRLDSLPSHHCTTHIILYAVCSRNGVLGALDVDLRSLEGYFVGKNFCESSQIWGVGGVSAVASSK